MRAFAIALAALIGVAALPDGAQATTCFAQILNQGTGTPAAIFKVTKGSVTASTAGQIALRLEGTWLRIFKGDTEEVLMDFGGCSSGHSIAQMESTALDYMELDLGRRYP